MAADYRRRWSSNSATAPISRWVCKQALDQAGGDMEKAIDWLRSQNSEDAA